MKLSELKKFVLSNATKKEDGSLDNIDWGTMFEEHY
jgi:hypothetical protein